VVVTCNPAIYKRRWLPGFSPSAFVDNAWRPHVVDSSRGRLDRRAYELCAAYELRSALRSGRLWVPGSRRHADPSSLLLPDEQWQRARASFAVTVERPLDVSERLDALGKEQSELLQRLADERDATTEACLADDGLVVAEPDTADQDAGRLRKLIEPRLPELDLPELLIEVDGWTGFTEHLVPLSSNRRRSADMPAVLYAAILAQATNLGLTGMTRASEFSYQQLEWAWEQLCREDTLTAASARLVDFHHGLPLALEWGAGRLSSSDGQRFAARGRGPGTAALPRYFGHRRRGLQIYSWTSDQYSQYASKVITATVRDATHTLDGILDNQTVLPIEEHTGAAGRAGALPRDLGERDHCLEHGLHPARARRAPRRRRADHHQRDRAHLTARTPAHPPLRPLPVRPRQPTGRAPTAQDRHDAEHPGAGDAEPRLT
jgi:Tn3 transposase DDE domain